jgi:hypothetical protein
MGDNNKIAGHILPKDFYNRHKDILRRFALANYGLLNAQVNADKVLSDLDEYSVNRDHVTQGQIEQAHDHLLMLTDLRLFHLCHLLKIHNFIPLLVSKLGDDFVMREFLAEGTKEPQVEHDGNVASFNFRQAKEKIQCNLGTNAITLGFSLSAYSNPQTIIDVIDTQIESSFKRLHELRKYFTHETAQERLNTKDRDSFSEIFFDNNEVEPHEMYSRMEYIFFLRMGVPLGIFQSSPEINQWISTELRRPARFEPLFETVKNGYLSYTFPAISVRNDFDSVNPCVTRSIRRDLFGSIPSEGIIIGDERNAIRNREQSRLVYQSPR